MSSSIQPENGRSGRLTIRQVADLAGVSTATVSRVVNGRTDVSERARAAVLRVVREYGYSTNRTARALSGGRTGLVGVTVAALFLLTLFLAPLAHSVPVYATAPALLFVACMMARGFAELDWEDVTEYAPAVVTALAMPLTFSIATGIALGFMSYVAIKLLSGRIAEAGPVMTALAVLFMLKYAFF